MRKAEGVSIKPAGLGWSCTAVIPAAGRLRQEGYEFEASLGYTLSLSQKQQSTLPCQELKLICYAWTIGWSGMR